MNSNIKLNAVQADRGKIHPQREVLMAQGQTNSNNRLHENIQSSVVKEGQCNRPVLTSP